MSTVAMTVETIEMTTGIWCDTCLLPSAIKHTWAATYHGATWVASRTICTGCAA